MATVAVLSPTSTQTTYAQVESAYAFRSDNAINEALREKIAISLGYNPDDTVHIPKDANIGEGCGNPLLIASLKEGETVVDLGSGGGFDCLLASKQVGPKGRVIGFDMTANMIELAQRNAEKMGAKNTHFVLSKINNLPLPDNSVDCVMSNCVLNLVPDEDKLSVIKEIHRVLKPCGRIAISDFLALKPLSDEIRNDEALKAGCVSGAIEVKEMEKFLFDLGFDDVLLVNTEKDLSLYKDGEGAKSVTPCCVGGSCGPGVTASGRKELDMNLNDWISSFQMYGHKWCGKTEQHLPIVTSVSDRTAMPARPYQDSGCTGPACC